MPEIQKTKDYAKFSLLTHNRAIRDSHVTGLKKSIEKQNLEIPIIVNEKWQIIDGQHRFKALQELGAPIVYLQRTGFGIKEVKALNSQQKNWTLPDYIFSYADEGYLDYQRLKKFRGIYGLPFSISAWLLMGKWYENRSPSSPNSQLRAGEFKIKNWDEACNRAEVIKEALTHIQVSSMTFATANFIKALLNCMSLKKFDADRFLKKLEGYPHKADISNYTKVSDYIAEIEKAYNFRATGSHAVPLKFLWERRIKK